MKLHMNGIPRLGRGWRLPRLLFIASMAALGCATATPSDKVRVAVLDITSEGGAEIVRDGQTVSALDEQGVRAVLEHELIEDGITVVDDAELPAVLRRYKDSVTLGIHTSATRLEDYQPAATHGVVVKVQENVGLLTLLTFGLAPHTLDTTARLIDLRSGEVLASVHAWSLGSVFSSGGAYRGVRKVAREIAEKLAEVQSDARHTRDQDWPTGFEASLGREAHSETATGNRKGRRNAITEEAP